RVTAAPAATMISTFSRTSSAINVGRRSSFPSASRNWIIMFFPSTYPSSRNPCRNASIRYSIAEKEAAVTYAVRGTFFGCCAWEEKKSEKSRPQRLITFFFICFFFPLPPPLYTPPFSFNSLTPPRQYVRRNGEADLLRGFQ